MLKHDSNAPIDNSQSIHRNGSTECWLQGGGAMGDLIRSMDWSQTSLGAIESWPQSLRTTVSLCLASNFPINIIWGPDHTQIFNDGYWPICGDKYRQVMGGNYRESWASAWSVLDDTFERALTGETNFIENQRMFLDRNGYLEECFFTFSLSPIRDEQGAIGGLFHPVTETSAKMLAERRSKALRELAAATVKAKNTAEVYALTMETLADFDLDISFAAIYEFNDARTEAHCVGHVGFPSSSAANESQVILGASPSPWPLEQMANNLEFQPIIALDGLVDRCAAYPEAPRKAMILSLSRPGSESACGALILGASPRLPFDAMYEDFFGFVAATLSAAMANADAYERERRRVEELAALDQAKTTFFSNISHEFRTPLTLMLVPLEELLNKAPGGLRTEVLTERLEVIHRNSLRLLKLVNTLLDFSRIEAGRFQAQFQATDLAAYTKDIVSLFESAAKAAGLELSFAVEPGLEPVYVDRSLWENIIVNLISNALKYTLAGFIRIRLRPALGQVELSVEDSGTGIPAAEIPRLFERFYRVQGSKGRSFEGSGIGLAMVHELIRLHGGSIHVESTVDVGSLFTVSIPLGTAHLPPDKVMTGSTAAHPSQISAMHAAEASFLTLQEDKSRNIAANTPATPKAHVLLVDDNKDMRDYIYRILAEYYEVTTAQDGLDALEKARSYHPDLILSDIMMPRLDGYGLLQSIRSDAELQTTPCIFLSARAGEEAKVEGLGTGADDYLTKPFSSRELMARVAAHLSMARLRKEAARREREWAAEIEAARRTNLLKDEFLATLSHEMLTPLTAIMGYSQILLNDELAAKRSFELSSIVRHGKQLNRVVHDLLDISQIIKGQFCFESQMVHMSEVLASALRTVSLSARSKRLRLEVQISDHLPCIQGDAGRLQQMLWNLLSNAISFTAPEGQVTIHLHHQGDALHLQVKDSGAGMDPHFLPFAMDPLRQEDGSNTRPHDGIGLGLSLVRQIVQAHGGRIHLASPGKGCGVEVTVILPIASERPQLAQG